MIGATAALDSLKDPRMLAAQAGFACFSVVEYGSWLALLLFAFDQGGVGEAGLVAVATLIPAALLAPFAAPLAGRLSAGAALAVGFGAQGLACGAVGLAIIVGAPVSTVYGLGAALAVAMTLSRPTLAAILPTIAVGPSQLAAANSLAGATETVGSFAGPGLAGLILLRGSPAAVFVAGAVALLVATVLALAVGRGRPEPFDDEPTSPLAEIVGGFRLLRSQSAPRLLVLMMAASWMALGALDVALVAVAVDGLGRSEATAGLLASAVGVGGIIGALLSFLLVGRRRLSWPMAAGLVAAGLPIAALAGTDSLLTVVVLLALVGVGDAIADVAGRTLLQGLAAQDTLAQVFGMVEGLGTAALALGSIGFSVLAVLAGLDVALLATGALLPAVLLLTFRALVAVDRTRPLVDPNLLSLIRRVPIFAPLPAFRAEQLLVNLQPVELPPGQVLFHRGDIGDRFYVVNAGSAIVHLDDRLIEHRRGDFFGEIALIKDRPRTAMVRAGDEGLSAYALERTVFLDAISAYPRSRTRTIRVADNRLEDQ